MISSGVTKDTDHKATGVSVTGEAAYVTPLASSRMLVLMSVRSPDSEDSVTFVGSPLAVYSKKEAEAEHMPRSWMCTTG